MNLNYRLLLSVCAGAETWEAFSGKRRRQRSLILGAKVASSLWGILLHPVELSPDEWKPRAVHETRTSQ